MRRAIHIESRQLGNGRGEPIDLVCVDVLAQALIDECADEGGFVLISYDGLPAAGNDRISVDVASQFLVTLMRGLAVAEQLRRLGRASVIFSDDEVQGVADAFERRSAIREVSAGGIALVIGGVGTGLLDSAVSRAARIEEISPVREMRANITRHGDLIRVQLLDKID
jgi:hypothetical protein